MAAHRPCESLQARSQTWTLQQDPSLTRISHLRVRLFLNSSSSGSMRPAQGEPQSSMRPLPLREPLSQRRRRSSLASGGGPRGRLLLRLLP